VLGTARRLSLVWGLHCVAGPEPDNLEDMIHNACRIALREGLAKPDQRIIVTAGVPLGQPGVTNMLRVAFVEGGR
jgi:pyruvate kinase